MKVIKLDLKNLDQNENSRVIYKSADLSDLMHSMKKDGLLQPIGVKKLINNKYEVVFGNRRVLAAKKLGWADIDANVLEEINDDNDRDVVNLVENLKRQNTTVSEDGRIFQALRDRGLDNNEIAARVGVDKQRVELALEVFNNVPKEFHKQIVNRVSGKPLAKNTISATAANKILHLRQRHHLNRKQTRDLMKFAARDESATTTIEHIAPLLKDGFTVGAAIKAAGKLTRCVMYVFVDQKNIERLEKKHKKTIHQLLWEQLEKSEELSVHRLNHSRFSANPREFKNQ